MNAQLNHQRWKAGESSRAAVLAEIDSNIDNLKKCTRWLIDHGISIVDAHVRRDGTKPVVTVVASPYLHMLFKADDTSAGQHWDFAAGRTAHDFVAVRFECEIRWTEVAK